MMGRLGVIERRGVCCELWRTGEATEFSGVAEEGVKFGTKRLQFLNFQRVLTTTLIIEVRLTSCEYNEHELDDSQS